ncbi:MAG: hypothetical protein Q7R66_13540 [Undibacterium sp.]|uniref:hypothetical protein n=1 Tax=Undibacterium sp. TaxID=1914977 RepID=UPI00271755FC|nr:hypothetical protein [Undibacterium sp.]MDO8653202.1 hypothetical protein [Undibacterium sp.]
MKAQSGESCQALQKRRLLPVNPRSVSAAKAEKYDFSNISPKALHETDNILIRSGHMNLDETSSLLCVMAPFQIGTDGSFTATSDSLVNVFAKIQAGIECALSRNDNQSVENLQRTADALLRYQGQTAKVYIQA